MERTTTNDKVLNKVNHIQQFGELAHTLTDAGLILITSISDIDEYELEMLKSLNHPNKTIVVNVGENRFSDINVDLILSEEESVESSAGKITELLTKTIALDPEFSI